MHTPRRHRIARDEAKFRQLAAALAGPTSGDALKLEVERSWRHTPAVKLEVERSWRHTPAVKLEVERSWRHTPAVEEGIDWDGMSLAERRDRES